MTYYSYLEVKHLAIEMKCFVCCLAKVAYYYHVYDDTIHTSLDIVLKKLSICACN